MKINNETLRHTYLLTVNFDFLSDLTEGKNDEKIKLCLYLDQEEDEIFLEIESVLDAKGEISTIYADLDQIT